MVLISWLRLLMPIEWISDHFLIGLRNFVNGSRMYTAERDFSWNSSLACRTAL
jgi:hypothetical protein